MFSHLPAGQPMSKKLPALSICRLLILTMCCAAMTGCWTLGVKENDRIIYVSFAAPLDEIQGAIRIATEKPIPVTVVGKQDISTKMNLAGYYAVSAADLRAFVAAVKAQKERAEQAPGP